LGFRLLPSGLFCHELEILLRAESRFDVSSGNSCNSTRTIKHTSLSQTHLCCNSLAGLPESREKAAKDEITGGSPSGFVQQTQFPAKGLKIRAKIRINMGFFKARLFALRVV
jgi:hypothetical protein